MEILEIIKNALIEDMPDGDITTDNLINHEHTSYANLIAKEAGIISGTDIFSLVMAQFDNVTITWHVNNGDRVANKQLLATIDGCTRSILKAERVALNLLQRMSGIATKTNQFVEAAAGRIKIYDTRKTTPNMRALEKRAVIDGGGFNHRYSLSDMVMIKDNHIKAAGSITNAVSMIREKLKHVKVEVEVESIVELEEALLCDVDIIMLDNMSLEMMSEAVKINNRQKILEASGNMTLERIEAVSQIGIDYVSVGELTHSIKALDISLKFKA